MDTPRPRLARQAAARIGWRWRLFGPLLAGLLALPLYLTTLTQVHTFDALSYITSVEHKPLYGVLFPHHLAYGPLSALAAALAAAVGYTGGAALPMQLVSVLAGTGGVVLLWATSERLTGRVDLSLLTTLLLASAYAYWYFAVEADVYALAAVLMLGCVALLLRLIERPTRWWALQLGLVHSAALLIHQANLLFVLAVVVVWWWQGRQRTEDGGGKTNDQRPKTSDKRAKAFIPYLLSPVACRWSCWGRWSRVMYFWWPYPVTGVLVVGAAYLAAALASGFSSWAEFNAWLTDYAQTGWWGGAIRTTTLANLGKGLADTLAQPGGALLGLLLLGLAVMHMRSAISRQPSARGSEVATRRPDNRRQQTADSRQKSEIPLVSGLGSRISARNLQSAICNLQSTRVFAWALGLWLCLHTAFFVWWEPENIKFWIVALGPVLLLLALVLRAARPWGAGVAIGLAIALTQAGVNYDSIVRRGDATTDLQRVIAAGLAAQLTPADLALVPDGMLELYLPYYHDHPNQLSLNQALFDSQGDWAKACKTVQQRIDDALHAGASVLLADEVLRPPALLLTRHRLVQPQIDACFVSYQALLAPVGLAAPIPRYWRLPRAAELANGPGWRFDSLALGWRATHVRDQTFAAGWRFIPERDPALLSPLLALDAARYQAIEVRLANHTQARDAQLFFAGPDGAITEARTLRWELAPTAAPTTYRIDLANLPGWNGVITRLRLDPVGVGDGGAVVVEWLRLVR